MLGHTEGRKLPLNCHFSAAENSLSASLIQAWKSQPALQIGGQLGGLGAAAWRDQAQARQAAGGGNNAAVQAAADIAPAACGATFTDMKVVLA
jgi:hypothetical protein